MCNMRLPRDHEKLCSPGDFACVLLYAYIHNNNNDNKRNKRDLTLYLRALGTLLLYMCFVRPGETLIRRAPAPTHRRHK